MKKYFSSIGIILCVSIFSISSFATESSEPEKTKAINLSAERLPSKNSKIVRAKGSLGDVTDAVEYAALTTRAMNASEGDPTWSPRFVLKQLQDPKWSKILMIKGENNKPLSAIAFWSLEYLPRNYRVLFDGAAGIPETNGIYIADLVTDPTAQNKGHGSALIKHVQRTASIQKKPIFLHVRQDNMGALNLYSKLGFRISGNVPPGVTSSLKPGYVMKWEP
jgi:ribosomal protein S18 acetylase RimI-like enzyme